MSVFWKRQLESARRQEKLAWARAGDLEAENERLRGVLEDVHAFLRTIDYREDVFEQVAPLERVLREALAK